MKEKTLYCCEYCEFGSLNKEKTIIHEKVHKKMNELNRILENEELTLLELNERFNCFEFLSETWEEYKINKEIFGRKSNEFLRGLTIDENNCYCFLIEDKNKGGFFTRAENSRKFGVGSSHFKKFGVLFNHLFFESE